MVKDLVASAHACVMTYGWSYTRMTAWPWGERCIFGSLWSALECNIMCMPLNYTHGYLKTAFS